MSSSPPKAAGSPPAAKAGALRRGKTIEQIYQKKSQLEHILLRPDTYVGSIEQQADKLWVFDDAKKLMVFRDVKFVPGMYKIFDEILVNAADNYQRDPENMTMIKVCINAEEGWISVENNGKTLPVEMHQEHKMYVPEMVFGHLLTSDNYDDDDDKVVGGRNGYGAKLTNIFSTKFMIECGDPERGKKYTQIWENNMGTKNKPNITKFSGKSFTKVTFHPDLSRFGMTKLDADIVSLMTKRVMDIAGSTNKKCSVFLNEEKIAIKEFKDYVNLYFETPDDKQMIYEKCSDRWEYVITQSEGQFQQVSFVNSINTTKGGTHVSHVAEQFVDAIHKKANSKNRGGMEIKPFHVRGHLWIFVNCLVVNPSFDSQTKETLTLKQGKFGSKCEVGDRSINKFCATGIVDTVLQWAKAKESIDMKKKMKATGRVTRILGVPKLEDANWAGTKNSEECTLILTEGDSAKSLAVAGLSVLGRDKYGVFPLRGKPLNVRDASFQQTMNNAEIQNVIKIMGLNQKMEYDSVKGLRYGSIMIMADQDYDGSHIKGLLLNMFQHWWPSLFKMEGFLKEFITPIVKVTKGPTETHFFTIADYTKWRQENNDGKGWTCKYYKGLGTSTSKEAKEYFQHIDVHEMSFSWTGERDDEAIDMAFNKKRADDRKDWINNFRDEDTVDHAKSSVTYEDFVKKELAAFAKYDVMRSIPSMVDGFKPSQRKVLFCAFKRNLKNDVKVAQFSGYISEHSAYHHGEVSLQGTIVGMAQTFVGSNNVNLFVPSGQFGTRLQGGKDAASARYIYTRLEKIARVIFHPDDDPILEYHNEEGQSIEPKWYIPVIPLALVNGATGIGTGWSTDLPNYNPRDIIKALKRCIKKQPNNDKCMIPWYKGFKGSIVPSNEEDASAGYDVVGVAQRKGETTIEITELPVKKWTQEYKEFLSKMVEGEEGKPGRLDDFKEYHTENSVHFSCTGPKESLDAMEKEGLEKVFKLRSSLATSNIMLFDEEAKIKRYNTEVDLLNEFAALRLRMYQKRKDYMTDRLTREKELLDAKVRFVLMVIKNELEISRRKKAELLADLKKRGFKSLKEIMGTGDDAETVPAAEGSEDKAAAKDSKPGSPAAKKAPVKKESESRTGYDYLLGMPLWNLTMEKVEELKRQSKDKTFELESLKKMTIEDLWERDLDAVLAELDAIDAEDKALAAEEANLKAGKRGRAKAKAKGKAKVAGRRQSGASKAESEDDEDDSDDEEDEPAPKRKKADEVPKDESPMDMLARLKDRQKSRSEAKLDDDETSPKKKAKAGE